MKIQNNDLSRNEITRYAISMLGLKSKSAISPNTKEMAFHCPFHKDKTPSMFINFPMGVYNCFSCGKSGNIESLYYDLTGHSLRRALGLSNDNFTNFAKIRPTFDYIYEEDYSLKNVYVNMDSSQMISAWQSRPCRDFLIKRGITEKVATDLNFQYAADTKINGTRFYRRLIIPIYEDKRLIAVEGRRIFDEDPDPKVLYARNCSVNSLFDIDNLDKRKPVYAVEGLMDLAVLRTCEFFKNSTSIFGANLTKRQLHLIEDFDKFIYINDRDEAGLKTVEKLKESGLTNIFILSPPKIINNIEIKDIGDLPKAGVSPQTLLERKWMSYLKKI